MKSCRYWALLMAMLIAGIFGGPRSADASAFLWISAPTWTYSAAAARCPIGFAHFWGLSVGHPSFSYAYAYCTSAFGSSAAYAVAATRRGGAGAAVALGFADPWATIDIGIPLLPDSTTPHDFASDALAVTDGSFTDAYDVTPDGITFTSPGAAVLNGTVNLAAYLYNGSDELNALCGLFGVAAGCSTSMDSAGNVTDLTDFETLFAGHLTPLGVLTNPDFSSPLSLDFNQTVDDTRVILVAQGNAASVPEPATLLLLGQGLLMFAITGAVRRRRRA